MNDFSPTSAAIDLPALHSRCLGNSALVERVLAKFTKQLNSDLTNLEQAVENGDPVQAADVAHRIKGTAGSVEARQLFRDASMTEQSALANRLHELPDCLDRLRNDRSDLVAMIAANHPASGKLPVQT